tara:strand:+ start:7270 stop:7851 length:582 start_codon:yes stop_codon:yes gene_type:complete
MGGGYGTAVAYLPHVTPKISVTMPSNAPPISQQFMPLTRNGGPGHMGLDVAAATGTPVLAAAPGRVSSSRFEPVYGNRIVVEHGLDATGRKVQTLYFHLDSRAVAVGARVARGQQIGTLGETGLLSSFPHLHFEYHREESPGARVQAGDNWWQGMVQEDPNRNWVGGPGRVACYTGQRAARDKITYPVACARR